MEELWKPYSEYGHYILKCLGNIENVVDFIGVSSRVSHIHGMMYPTECNRCAPEKGSTLELSFKLTKVVFYL